MKKLVFYSLIGVILLAVALSAGWYVTADMTELQPGWYAKRSGSGENTHFEFTRKRLAGWVPLQRISPLVVGAIVVAEDWAFYDHHGVDPRQLFDAVEESWRKKRLVRGASTISQQLVKNLFLSKEKSLIRKWKELVLTVKLENHLSKKRILELYLNVIEFGPNVYGIGRAADYYFSTAASELSVREAAFIAMLLPNPPLYSVSFRHKRLTPFAQRRIRTITKSMVQARIITPQDRKEALADRFSWEEFEEKNEMTASSAPAADDREDEDDRDDPEEDESFAAEEIPEVQGDIEDERNSIEPSAETQEIIDSEEEETPEEFDDERLDEEEQQERQESPAVMENSEAEAPAENRE